MRLGLPSFCHTSVCLCLLSLPHWKVSSVRAGTLPCCCLVPGVWSTVRAQRPLSLDAVNAPIPDPVLVALFSLGASVLSCLLTVASGVWEVPGASQSNTDPSGLSASRPGPASLLHISDRLRRHALGKQIIEKITPGWDSWTADLWHVIPTSGVYYQLKDGFPTWASWPHSTSTSHADLRWLPGCLQSHCASEP